MNELFDVAVKNYNRVKQLAEREEFVLIPSKAYAESEVYLGNLKVILRGHVRGEIDAKEVTFGVSVKHLDEVYLNLSYRPN